MHGTNYCATGFLQKTLELNPELTFIERLISVYNLQCGKGFAALIDMEGGFRLMPEVIKDKEKMKSAMKLSKLVSIVMTFSRYLKIFRKYFYML